MYSESFAIENTLVVRTERFRNLKQVQDSHIDGDSMRVIDQMHLQGKAKVRIDNPKETIISKGLHGTAHLNKLLSSQTEECAPGFSQSCAMLSSLFMRNADAKRDTHPSPEMEIISDRHTVPVRIGN
jgi:quinolinate synthase